MKGIVIVLLCSRLLNYSSSTPIFNRGGAALSSISRVEWRWQKRKHCALPLRRSPMEWDTCFERRATGFFGQICCQNKRPYVGTLSCEPHRENSTVFICARKRQYANHPKIFSCDGVRYSSVLQARVTTTEGKCLGFTSKTDLFSFCPQYPQSPRLYHMYIFWFPLYNMPYYGPQATCIV